MDASADLIGPNSGTYTNYVWGITGQLNTSKAGNVFEGTFVIGYLPDPTVQSGATLVQQGSFEWQMTQNTQGSSPPFLFQSGTINVLPKYAYPTSSFYPLIFGNLNPFHVNPSKTGDFFTITASKYWCSCNCPSSGNSGSTGDAIADGGGSDNGVHLSQWKIGTIVVVVVGGIIVIVSLVFIFKMYRPRRTPVNVEDNNDDDDGVMDPQKPDYGSIAINEIFEDDRDYA